MLELMFQIFIIVLLIELFVSFIVGFSAVREKNGRTVYRKGLSRYRNNLAAINAVFGIAYYSNYFFENAGRTGYDVNFAIVICAIAVSAAVAVVTAFFNTVAIKTGISCHRDALKE